MEKSQTGSGVDWDSAQVAERPFDSVDILPFLFANILSVEME